MKYKREESVDTIKMKCSSCGKEFQTTARCVRDFIEKNQKCACGHEFDFEALWYLLENIKGGKFVEYLESDRFDKLNDF